MEIQDRAATCSGASAVTDKRVKRGGQQCNFYIYYKVDDEEVPTALRLEEYQDEAEYGWVLLAAAPEGRRACGCGCGGSGRRRRDGGGRGRVGVRFYRAGARGRPRFLGTVDENERRDFLM